MKLDLEKYEMTVKEKKKIRGKFINRELSLIDFDERVLLCAINKDNPLNERLKFLSITDSNLDEMIGVRFAYTYHNQDTEPYKKILKRIKKFKKAQYETYQILKDSLGKNGMKFSKVSDLKKNEKDKLHEVYLNNIFPLLTPISVKRNDVPVLTSCELCIVVNINSGNSEDIVIIPINKNIDKIYQIGNKIVFIEDIIFSYMSETLLINKDIIDKGVFRIIRDASVILSHDTNRFIVDRMSETIKLREHGAPLFLDVTSDTSEKLIDTLMNLFKIPSGHVHNGSKILYYHRFMQPIMDNKESYKKFTPYIYENSNNFYDMFEAISHEDILLHHPYDSYETVVKFIKHAANDKHVLAIKQTLYRVSSIESPIVEALCTAARNGKKVSVLIEIKARFDEENNIKLISKLQSAGATILLGNEWLKTHCKLCVVIREEKNKLRIYSHVATGNYNEKTSQIYTDLSYFTCKQKIGMDLLHIFNILSGHSNPDEKLQKIYYSPITLRKKLIACIDREISLAKKGKKAEIFMKINSLSDRIMADKIYEAADKGVKVYIICRGVCSIVPRKNLFIKSIVGRFLEHSRIYYFKNGSNHEYYISSADLLTRNLDKRVETLISLKDSEVIKQLEWITDVYKSDQANSFIMTKDGEWVKSKGDFSCHDWFIKHTDDMKKIKKG
jgi:polyphosphate kinase